METKHTSGKWLIQDPKGVIASTRIHSNNATIAKVQAIDEMEANAKLIASAPDLLEALIKAHDLINVLAPLNNHEDGSTIGNILSESLNAIKKATE